MLAPDSPDFRAILDAAWKQSCSAASQAVAASGDNSAERAQPGYLLGFSDEPGRTIATKLDAWWQDNHSLQQVTDLLQRGLVNRFWGDALWALLRNAATASSVVDSA
ncbi:MAG: hypothetical protein D6753_06120 [Planctomycetota bacterium]|nr:MAG: hypothetical protein D6753_06120 [Planctomycetota bacterium]